MSKTSAQEATLCFRKQVNQKKRRYDVERQGFLKKPPYWVCFKARKIIPLRGRAPKAPCRFSRFEVGPQGRGRGWGLLHRKTIDVFGESQFTWYKHY